MLVVLIVRIPEDKTLPPGNDLKKADGSKIKFLSGSGEIRIQNVRKLNKENSNGSVNKCKDTQ
ncbi:MAG: hypothetical protein A2Y87_10820 [Bacteroidetes bacterium RBG_13_46_8]|nr:MAG: hypothetical protein A2Y87_10820 [Bacteroidetes bacterium RBG_13_46_8]